MLSWLLGEADAEEVRSALATSEMVISSILTLIECDRVLLRAMARGQLREAEVADRRVRLSQAATHWTLLGLESEIVDRARRPFPGEPIRTLDAIHLASLLVTRDLVPGAHLLSLDKPVRECARQLGFQVLPG